MNPQNLTGQEELIPGFNIISTKGAARSRRHCSRTDRAELNQSCRDYSISERNVLDFLDDGYGCLGTLLYIVLLSSYISARALDKGLFAY